jgi:hypothetical protein
MPFKSTDEVLTSADGGARLALLADMPRHTPLSPAQTCNAALIIAYKMQRLAAAASCPIDTIREPLERQ